MEDSFGIRVCRICGEPVLEEPVWQLSVNDDEFRPCHRSCLPRMREGEVPCKS